MQGARYAAACARSGETSRRRKVGRPVEFAHEARHAPNAPRVHPFGVEEGLEQRHEVAALPVKQRDGSRVAGRLARLWKV